MSVITRLIVFGLIVLTVVLTGVENYTTAHRLSLVPVTVFLVLYDKVGAWMGDKDRD